MALSLKHVPPQRGAAWVREAFALFGRRPFGFCALLVVFLFAAMLVLLVPMIGGALQLMLLPLLTLGFMIATRSAMRGGHVQPGQFIEPLAADPKRRRDLLVLCVAYGIAAELLLWLCDAIAGGSLGRLQHLLASGDAPREEIDALMAEPGVFLGTVAGLVGVTLLSVPFWHAPALVHWGHQSAGQALFSSTMAVWRSKGAFLVYGMVWFGVVSLFGVLMAVVLGILGAPQLVGVVALPAGLIFSTVFYVSLMFTFSDSFGGPNGTETV